MGINAENVLRLLNQKQETRGERIARLVAEKRAQQGGTATVVSSVPEATAAQENNDRFFKAGAFSDGYQFGDVIKTILGTAGDVGVNAAKGAGSLVEGVTDLLGYAGAGIADLVGADEFASDWKKSVQKNTVDAIFKGAEDYVDQASVLGGRSDAISQGLGQVAAIILTGGVGASALGSAGATALTTAVTGLSGVGSGMSQAYQEGATDGEAVAYGAIAGTAEALTEWIFAGMGKSVKALGFSKGLSSADDILAKKLSSKISSQLGKNLVELGVKAGAEGTEEVLSGVAQAFGKKLTYMSEEDLGKIVKDERLLDQFITGAITSGIAQSGIVPGMKAGSFIEATKAGRDFITVDDTDTDKMAQKNTTQEGGVKYSLAAFEKDGRRFVEIDQNQERFDGHSPDEYPGIAKEIIKEKFENRVIGIDNKMFVNGAGRSEFAYPSKPITDADIYEAKMRSSAELDNLLDAGANYRNEADGKDGHVHPDAVGGFDYYDTLFKIGNRYFEGRINIKNVKRGKLFTDVTQIKDVTQAIMSSYGQNPKSQFLRTSSIDSISNANENVNSQVSEDADYQERYKQYQVDLSQYKPQEQAIYKRHMDSGMVNNRKATHEFVDLLVKLEMEQGVHFDLSTSERLAQSSFAVEGATINGVKTGNGILLNINANNVINSVVGHEIMHVFEGTDYEDVLKQAVKEFAEAKGIYKSRYDSIAKLYAKVQGADIEGELTADLIGEYLFTDKDFVRNLSTKHRNLFQRIYDEIKYLCKLATADSAEARKLEKVKKTFAEMYRNVDVKNTAQTDGVKYALGDIDFPRKMIDYNDISTRRAAEDKTAAGLIQQGKTTIIKQVDIPTELANVDWGNKTESRNAIKEILKHFLGEDVIFNLGDESAIAYLTAKGLDHTLAGENTADKAIALSAFYELISNAEYSYSGLQDQHSKTVGRENWDYFVSVAQIEGGGTVPLVFAVRSIDQDVRSQIYSIATKKNLTIPRGDGTQGNPANAHPSYGDSSSSNGIVEQNNQNVNRKFSLSETKTAESAGGYRITGEDIALAPTKEDIAAQEIATAQDAPRNDVEELGAPTREDILRMEADKELHGPWRMTDPLDQKVEKLYRMMLREQVSEEEYIAQLVKADRQYQQRGSKVEAALERVREAYSKETAETPETEKKMERLTRKVLHKGIMDRIRDALAKAGFDLNDILKNAKNLSTFATVDNTPQRVNEKTFGYKAGQIINDLTINKAALNESDAIQWLNGQIDKIRKMSERYGIKPGSKESRAAQIYGEGFWVNEVGEYIQYGDAELAADFPDTKKQAKIKALAKSQEVRQMYDETLDAINAARVRNGYPPIPRRDNYFLHFRAQDDTFSRIGVPFNPNDIRAKDLPTDLNGVTADLKPGKPFFASEMQRTGDKTTYDLLGGLERYMNSAKNQIYHIDDIQTLRAMRNYIADMFGQANGLADLDSLSPEEQEQRIKEVFDNHLSTYAKFLNEEANIFAGKTALIDRGVEGVLGRRAIQFLHTLNGQVGKNMVGYNISSAGTNVLPVVQATAMLPKADMVKAFAQTISNKFRSDGFVENDPALIRRKGADQFAKTPWQRISDPGYALMSAVDNLSSELIVRAKYNELTRKGMDSQQAHIRAGEWASRLMGDRSLGQMPQLYNSKTLGLFTKFQLEVRNQLDAMGYDVIQEAKAEEGASNAKKAAKVASTMAQLAIFQHLFGQAYESIAGYNPTFDIVENLIKLFGFDDDEESEDTVGDNVEQAFLGLLEDLPYTSTLTGGRIPISSALPIEEVITGKDSYGNEKNRLETLAEALPYYILPGGYGQAKKTVAGLKMFDEDLPVAGSYTESGNLRFPVEEDSIADWLQAALFGQYASQKAREYFDNGWAPLQEKQIEEFAALDIPIADYREIRKQLGKLETIGEKFDYIDSMDLTVEQKNILVNNVVDRKEPVDMTNYGFFEDFDEFNFYIKNEEKYQFLKDNGIAYKTYNASEESREAYSWAFQNPEKYQVSRAVAEDTVAYKGYAKDLSAIKADTDSKGNAVSGSRKKKVVQYINGLDMEYGAKLVLYKMEYPSDDTYNGKIIEYVNGIEGFTYEQKETVLKELGFTVSSDGKVSWN